MDQLALSRFDQRFLESSVVRKELQKQENAKSGIMPTLFYSEIIPFMFAYVHLFVCVLFRFMLNITRHTSIRAHSVNLLRISPKQGPMISLISLCSTILKDNPY